MVEPGSGREDNVLRGIVLLELGPALVEGVPVPRFVLE